MDNLNEVVGNEQGISDLRFLSLLSKRFPTIADACTEIINLEAILDLPKGTEHFLTDIHGEYEAFQHVLKMHRVRYAVKWMKFSDKLCERTRKRVVYAHILSCREA